MSDRLQPTRDFLVSLPKQLNEISDDVLIATVEERSADTSVTRAAGTSNAMDVVVNVAGQIIVDDMGDVGNVKSTGSNGRSYHDGSPASSKSLESHLSFALGTITVDGGSREVVAHQEVAQHVRHPLCFDEHKSEPEVLLGLRSENVKQDAPLIEILNILDLLSDVFGCASNSSNAQEDIILQKVLGKHLNVSGECSTEHEGLTVRSAGHILSLNNTPDLGLETHVKHAIGLVKDEILDVGEADAATFDQVNKTARCGAKEVTTTFDKAELLIDIGSTVNDGRANPGPIRELPCLVMNLGDKLTGGGEDQSGRISFTSTTVTPCRRLGWGRARAFGEGSRENGEEEATCFTGTGLSTSHQVPPSSYDRDGILLNGSRSRIHGEANILQQNGIQRRAGEREYGLGYASTGSLDGNIVVLFKVDASVLFRGISGIAE